MGKRITLLTYGTRGDVEPFLALATALVRVGYQTRLAAPRPFEAPAGAHDIPFVGLEGDPAAVSAALTDRAGLNPLGMVRFLSAYIYPLAAQVFRQATRAVDQSDAVVHSFLMTDAGHHLAVERGLPDLSAQFFPVFSPTAAYPAPVFPDWPLGPGYRRLTHRVVTATFRLGGAFLYERLRRSTPGLPSLHRWQVDRQGRIQIPLLLAYSPRLVPEHAELGPNAWVTGYWIAEKQAEWRPDPRLEQFLEQGPKPVFIGFGSMASQRHERTIRTCIQALQKAGFRAVVAGGAGLPGDDDVPGLLQLVGEVPHSWLFPRMGAIVHHGGAGTTGAATRSGVPQVIIPFSADQAFWGRRVLQAGIGPPPIPLRRLSPDGILRAVNCAVGKGEMQARAAALGVSVRSEHGTAQAIEVIRNVVGPP
jgi:sterol 3beta-glucosyltransferase